MTMPHLMNCPHKGGTWCLKCVGEEWDRREAERDAMSARIAELERKAKAFDAIRDGAQIRPNERGWVVRLSFRDDIHEAADLLTAIEAAIAAKEGK